MAQSPLIVRLRKRARRTAARALDELLADEGRSEVFNAAVRGVQRGRRQLDERGVRILAALGLATRDDLEKVQRRVARLRKRMQSLADMLEDEG